LELAVFPSFPVLKGRGKMANLHVTIVVRTTSPEGKRGWTKANGKTDPAGPLYLRYCQGRKPRYEKAGANLDEAEAAKIRLERKLKARSQGFVLPEETVDAKKSHRISDVIAAYLADLRLNRRPAKSVKSKKFELEEFARFCGKAYVEEIRRADLVAYRNHLLDAGKAPVTAINKLMSVTTWLKKNPVVAVTGLLKAEDWPKKPDSPALHLAVDQWRFPVLSPRRLGSSGRRLGSPVHR
jgi:hypothetical protein